MPEFEPGSPGSPISPASPVAPNPIDSDQPPRWHTLALVGFLLLVAVVGTLSTAGGARGGGGGTPTWGPYGRVVGAYVPAIAANVMLVAYVARIGRRKAAWRELVGRRWDTWRRMVEDVGLAIVAGVLIVSVELGWGAVFGAPSREWVNALLPATPFEKVAWVVVAVAVGVGEEVVYRGYLQRELAVLSRSPALGIVAQAGLFGIAHGEQGAGAVVRCFVYGVGLGLLTWRRGSLVPVVMAHVGLDVLAGMGG